MVQVLRFVMEGRERVQSSYGKLPLGLVDTHRVDKVLGRWRDTQPTVTRRMSLPQDLVKKDKYSLLSARANSLQSARISINLFFILHTTLVHGLQYPP
jgi:hypothetical protein